MTRLLLVEDDERVGYVDTEKPEVEYNGDDGAVLGYIVDQVGKYKGAPSDDHNGPDQFFDGEELEEWIYHVEDEHQDEFDATFKVKEAGSD